MNILVLCTGNSCRSQIAEAYLRMYAPENVIIYSAGIEAHGINENARQILLEDGIDISNQSSNLIEEYLDIQFQFIITVCDHAQERCPIFPSDAIKIHQNFSDPSKKVGTKEEVHQSFLQTRDEIKQFCKKFMVKQFKTTSEL